jgi:hypothetical protein
MRYLSNTPFPVSKEKPLGYSWFPYDLVVFPQSWAQEVYPNMVFYKSHSKVSCFRVYKSSDEIANRIIQGGHFACLEQVEEFLEDIEAFVEKVSDSFKKNVE